MAAHCSPSVFTLEVHLLDHLADDPEIFRSLQPTDEGPFGHYDVHIKKSCEMISRRLPTEMYETVDNVVSALHSVPQPRRNMQESFCRILL